MMTQKTRKSIARGSREWVIAALLMLAAALCWISWRAGSPLLSGVRAFDVEAELKNFQGARATPVFKVP
jgi:hypothetical protein